MTSDRDRDASRRPRQARPRDALGRPLPYGSAGVEPVSEEPLPPAETLVSARNLLEAGRPKNVTFGKVSPRSASGSPTLPGGTALARSGSSIAARPDSRSTVPVKGQPTGSICPPW